LPLDPSTSLRRDKESSGIAILTLTDKILENPLDKTFDDISGGSADSIPHNF
jgi:hypothetical protein